MKPNAPWTLVRSARRWPTFVSWQKACCSQSGSIRAQTLQRTIRLRPRLRAESDRRFYSPGLPHPYRQSTPSLRRAERPQTTASRPDTSSSARMKKQEFAALPDSLEAELDPPGALETITFREILHGPATRSASAASKPRPAAATPRMSFAARQLPSSTASRAIRPARNALIAAPFRRSAPSTPTAHSAPPNSTARRLTESPPLAMIREVDQTNPIRRPREACPDPSSQAGPRNERGQSRISEPPGRGMRRNRQLKIASCTRKFPSRAAGLGIPNEFHCFSTEFSNPKPHHQRRRAGGGGARSTAFSHHRQAGEGPGVPGLRNSWKYHV